MYFKAFTSERKRITLKEVFALSYAHEFAQLPPVNEYEHVNIHFINEDLFK